MKLHEGTFLKRILIIHSETSSAATFRTILRLTEWLGTLDATFLNRIVLYIQVWPDLGSNATPADTIMLKVGSYGKEWGREFSGTGRVGGAYNLPDEMEFNIAYPNGVNPSVPTDTLIKLRTNSWTVSQTQTYLVEINAYLLDVITDAITLTD